MGVINNIKSLINTQKAVNGNEKKAMLSEYDYIALNFNFRNDDIFLLSYPKSGNTWTRFIIANLLQKEEDVTFRNIELYVPDIHKSYHSIYQMEAQRFIKSHYQHLSRLSKFIYIVRDGRDAAVSFYHYEIDRKAFNGSFSDFLRSDHIKSFGIWQDHVKNALDYYYNKPGQVLLLKYERMIANLPLIVEKIARFCYIKTTCEDIGRVVEKCTFESLKENEEKFGPEIMDTDIKFFRKGTCNQWKEYFSEEDHEYFLWYNAEMLIKNGYNINY